MTSVFEHALRADFGRLHPRLQRRFGVDGDRDQGCVGTGVMDRVWRGGAFTVPFLHVGTLRHILFPETGTGIPFTIENYAYPDTFGRPTLTFVRTFQVRPHRRRRFDATMVYDGARDTVIDYLGTTQHLAVDLDVSVDARGGLRIRSGPQTLRGGVRCPAAVTGEAEVHEWWDERAERFRIRVTVTNRRFGPLFGYHGSFTAAYVPAGSPVPAAVRPLRENPSGARARPRALENPSADRARPGALENPSADRPRPAGAGAVDIRSRSIGRRSPAA
ncbi:hypothetical protein GCM10010112_24590 [Actinoplanes lobatus]|uniref:DUF4166 domain-containing protein n=1 Tax=Actinoplanes lobatus TaxID=113568 RepID=A0A7W7MIY8_9ACTN|nr:DUF4166 domain-containing protein [Actinoplanes lobatus]MBB4751500.1 hypothetical protein [Actinoplanes lobatus]GGN64411.1 hypothetical protein GCM10010112_24590 [Actinoplanes lobatus]GIE41110.1 hypothetical protein Alo02nite_40080 [Actinoplanes lobatus]